MEFYLFQVNFVNYIINKKNLNVATTQLPSSVSPISYCLINKIKEEKNKIKLAVTNYPAISKKRNKRKFTLDLGK